MPLGSEKAALMAASGGGGLSQYFGDGGLGNCQFGASAITQTGETVAIDSVLSTGSESGGPGSNSYGSQVPNSSACYEGTVLNTSGSYDGDMWVANFKDLTIDASVTLTVDQPCRGALIYVDGDCSIAGSLSMTSRGGQSDPTISGGSDSSAVSSTGIRLPMLTASGTDTLSAADFAGCGDAAVAAVENQVEVSGDGTIFAINRAGGAAGAGCTANAPGGAPYWANCTGSDGGAGGGTGSAIETGGGGGAGAFNSGSGGLTGGSGAAGTCFSGGPAGGGACGANCTDTGGSGAWPGGGGGGGTNCGGGFGSSRGGGGAGNPGAASGSYTAGQSGIGGLLILVVSGDLTISGSLSSVGTNGGTGLSCNYGQYGGGSGGGAVMALYAGTYSLTGSVSVSGGTSGSGVATSGDGAAGQSHVAQVSAA